jgi:4-hydroxy-tetrahydrodipicolinate synthase
VNPAAIYNLFTHWQSDQAEKLQEELDIVRNVFQAFPMIPALKSAAALYSEDPNWFRVRPPLTALNNEQIMGLSQKLKNIGFAMPGIREVQ